MSCFSLHLYFIKEMIKKAATIEYAPLVFPRVKLRYLNLKKIVASTRIAIKKNMPPSLTLINLK